MNNYLMVEAKVLKKVDVENIKAIEGYNAVELQRMFDLPERSEDEGYLKMRQCPEVGPNYFLVGGPYPGYRRQY